MPATTENLQSPVTKKPPAAVSPAPTTCHSCRTKELSAQYQSAKASIEHSRSMQDFIARLLLLVEAAQEFRDHDEAEASKVTTSGKGWHK